VALTGGTTDGPRGPARSCPSCGAAVDLDPHLAADRCAFCATPLVALDLGSHERADRVAPFVLTREQAADRLSDWLADRVMAPESVRSSRRPERLHGVFVPFYVFDADARSEYQGRVGIHWYRTETYTVVVNGKTQHRTRVVKETEWFQTAGTHLGSYEDHLVSASKGLPEGEANALEPFDVGAALPYADERVSGFVVERPTVARSDAQRVASAELHAREQAAIQRWHPADVTGGLSAHTAVSVRQTELVLLPVWIASFRFGGEPARLLVNGQTGEVIGKVPTSFAKVAVLVALGLALVAAAALLAERL
jgi:hypothetical protein